MSNTQVKNTHSNSKRTNEQWVDQLSGQCGTQIQQQAIDELARYLFVVAFNDLSARHMHIARLSNLDSHELSQLANDFLQQFMEKLVQDEFALLEKYHAKGSFTTWAAKVILNIARSELRRARWSVDVAFPFQLSNPRAAMMPDVAVFNSHIYETIQCGMEQLPTQMREVFVRLVLEGEKAGAIAEEMGVTSNTVYLIVHRARKKIRKFMLDEGYQAQDLAF